MWHGGEGLEDFPGRQRRWRGRRRRGRGEGEEGEEGARAEGRDGGVTGLVSDGDACDDLEVEDAGSEGEDEVEG